jgi:hypothetical protein
MHVGAVIHRRKGVAVMLNTSMCPSRRLDNRDELEIDQCVVHASVTLQAG